MKRIGNGTRVLAVSNLAEFEKQHHGISIDAVEQNSLLKSAYDLDGNKSNDFKQVSVDGKTYDIYPWGADNLLPQKCISMIRSNGDAMNLINTRADFLYGGGIDFFEEIIEGENITYKAYRNNKIRKYREQLRIDELVGQLIVSLAETWCFVVNKKMVVGMPVLENVDVSTFRWVKAKDSSGKLAVLSPDWNDQAETQRAGVAVPVVRDDENKDRLIFKKVSQSGQPSYPIPTYWTEESLDFLETMNFSSAKIRQNTKSNNNIGQIWRISEEYITSLANDTPDLETADGEGMEDEAAKRERVRNEIYDMLNEFTFSGTRTVIFDECTVDSQTGKMLPNLVIEEVKRSLNAEEFSASYELSLRGFSNSSGLISGLSGVSDGGKLGGSGSEVKVSANYEQTFRTNRERVLVTTLIDRTYRKFLELPDNVVVRFRNLVLVNDNADKSGVSSTMKTETNPKA